MTIETFCYVCGKDGLFINGLCPDCTMNELFNPGAAYAATFGSLDIEPLTPDESVKSDEGNSDEELLK